jgi:MFS family permease
MIYSMRALQAQMARRVFLAIFFGMIIAAILSMAVTITQFERGFRPILAGKAESAANKVVQELDYAMSIGVPADKIRGVDELLKDLVDVRLEIASITVEPNVGQNLISSAAGNQPDQLPIANSKQLQDVESVATDGFFETFKRSIVSVTQVFAPSGGSGFFVSRPIVLDGIELGQVTATVDPDFIQSQMQSVFFDTLVIMFAVGLVALEVVVVFLSHNLVTPLRKVDEAVTARANGDLSQYRRIRERGSMQQFVERLNAANAALRERAKGGLSALDAKKTLVADSLLDVITRFRLTKISSARRASIIDARIPLFVFCVAEELQKSFLPLFVAEYYKPTDFLDKSFMIGLPISVFMFVIAALTPFAGKLVDRFGARNLFLLGLIPAVAGYLGCYMAQSANQIVLARGTTAVGYAVITIACQSYIAAIAAKEARAKAMATFVGVLMAATMCGTAIGGILADWLGYKPVFLIAAGLAGVAGWLGYAMLSRKLENDTPATITTISATVSHKRKSSLMELLGNTQFVLIVLFCAIPAKIILTGFLYLLVPIYLASLENSQSEIGRVMMIYSLIIIPISPLASGFADRLGKNLWIVITATVASGIVLIGLYQNVDSARILTVVALLGLVHAFIKAPLIVSAMEAAERSPNVTRTDALSFLRTSERVGSVIGPVVVAAMLVRLDYNVTAVIIGVGVTLSGIIMALIMINSKRSGSEGGVAHA